MGSTSKRRLRPASKSSMSFCYDANYPDGAERGYVSVAELESIERRGIPAVGARPVLPAQAIVRSYRAGVPGKAAVRFRPLGAATRPLLTRPSTRSTPL